MVDAHSEELLHVGQYPILSRVPYFHSWEFSEDFPGHYTRAEDGSAKLSAQSTVPPPVAADSLAAAQRERIPPPRKAWDFLPDLMAKTEDGGYHPRKDVKPLHVVQPEGVSFKMDGHVLEWQNWKMHIGELLPTLQKQTLVLNSSSNSIYSPGGYCFVHNHI